MSRGVAFRMGLGQNGPNTAAQLYRATKRNPVPREFVSTGIGAERAQSHWTLQGFCQFTKCRSERLFAILPKRYNQSRTPINRNLWNCAKNSRRSWIQMQIGFLDYAIEVVCQQPVKCGKLCDCSYTLLMEESNTQKVSWSISTLRNYKMETVPYQCLCPHSLRNVQKVRCKEKHLTFPLDKGYWAFSVGKSRPCRCIGQQEHKMF